MSRYLEFISNHPFLTAAAAALIGIIIAYEFSRATRGYRELEAADTTPLINREDAQLVDVRAPAEYGERHALHAINVPASEIDARIDELKKHGDRPLVVYCGNGLTDSGKAAAALARAGLPRVYHLKGGLGAWEAAGMPLARGGKGKHASKKGS